MEQQLPEVLDLLSVSVEAGLGFEQAVHHITMNMEGPLIDELTVTYREMAMGRARRDALTLLGQRCELEEMKTFVGALVQASQLGISIKNVLRSQSAAMRQSRKAKVQEKAMKVSVKMLFPMVMFIFPVIFIILLGPAVVNVLHVING
jgi:tight adherence protein C